MEKKKSLIPFFTKGDVGGLVYMVANNIVNYIIIIATLQGFGWPDDIIFGRVIPALSIGLLAGGIYYAWMACKLSRELQTPDVTALPSGISTPAMFVILFGVISPLHYAIGDPEIEWAAAAAACFIGGFVEFLGGFVGPWIKKHLPRAALLGTVAGIGFIWMATEGVFDVFADPVVGLPVLGVAMLGLFAGYAFPKKISPFMVAIVGGIVYAFCLGRTSFDFTQVGFYFPNPVNTVQALINGFVYVIPYLTVVIPVEIYNFVETMDNVESANAAGDGYSVREAQFADGICTMVSAMLGGVVPNTVWLGHPGLKKTKAGAGYSWISGVILGLAGVLGLFTVLDGLVPPAVAAITFLWCAVIIVAQAFKECKPKHYAAISIAMVPSIADYLFTQVEAALATGSMMEGGWGIWSEMMDSGIKTFQPEVNELLLVNGAMWSGVPEVKAGAIIIGILLGTLVVFMIDRKLRNASYICFAGAVLSMFGFIHHGALGFYPLSPFVIGWFILAVILFVLDFGKGKWFDAPDDFEYV
ncbi:MAG: xanthine/uracil/vitamin C permease [Lachnospiraceae bacterium]|nr:xanthine/uracil/vitamin C permease [Lachnospiraceae bacterium]